VTTTGVKGSVRLWRAISSTQKLTDLKFSLSSGRRRHTRELVQGQENLLRSQAASLEELCIQNWHYEDNEANDHDFKLQLPVMKKLSRLSLSFKYLKHDHSDPEPGPFNIVAIQPAQVPNLQTLKIYPGYLYSGVLANSPFQSVQELVIQEIGSDFDILPIIGPCFPNLKKLRKLIIDLGIKEMGMIVKSWPLIEELDILIWPKEDFNLVASGMSGESKWWLEEAKLARDRGLPFHCPVNQGGPSFRHLTCKYGCANIIPKCYAYYSPMISTK